MTDQPSSASGSGGGKRPRGRPLKSTVNEDESAIKRRARVRKAQQAFQKRKEAAARSLRDRLTAVQNGLEEFSTAFSSFTTTVAQSGIPESHPELLRQLHGLTEQLIALARTASPDSPQEPEAGPSRQPPDDDDEEEQDPPPPATGQGLSQRIGAAVSPGVEHLFLSDVDPTPSRESSEAGTHASYTSMDQMSQPSTRNALVQPLGPARMLPMPSLGYASHRTRGGLEHGQDLVPQTTSATYQDLCRADNGVVDRMIRNEYNVCLDSWSREELLYLAQLGSLDIVSYSDQDFTSSSQSEDSWSLTPNVSALSPRQRVTTHDETDTPVSMHEAMGNFRGQRRFGIAREGMSMHSSNPYNAVITSQSLDGRSYPFRPLDLESTDVQRTEQLATHKVPPAQSRPMQAIPDNSSTLQTANDSMLDSQASYLTAYTLATITLGIQTFIDGLATISACTEQDTAYIEDFVGGAVVSPTITVTA